jgi:hypothetical protein
MAWNGRAARVATSVAIAFDASWKPLVTAKAKASASARPKPVCIARPHGERQSAIAEVVPAVVELRGGGPVGWSDGGERSGLLGGRRGNGSTPRGAVAFDGVGELGEVGVADDLAELAFGFEHAGGRPAQAHVPGLPALDVA